MRLSDDLPYSWEDMLCRSWCLFTQVLRAVVMHLTHKPADLHSNAQHPCKSQVQWLTSVIPALRSRAEISWSLSHMMNLRVQRGAAFKNKVEDDRDPWYWPPYLHMYTLMCRCTQPHEYILILPQHIQVKIIVLLWCVSLNPLTSAVLSPSRFH